MEKVEVAVVGAGPAGLLAAIESAKRGVHVEVYEEHTSIGEPNHCAGLVSIEGLHRLGLDHDRDFVQNEITGGIIYSPKGTAVRIEGKRPRAYAIDRAEFDRFLASAAQKAGARINIGQRVKGLILEDAKVHGIRTSDQIIDTDVVIDAEGSISSLIAPLGLGTRRRSMLAGVNTEVEAYLEEPQMVEVWLGRDIAPGFFAWVIPIGKGKVRCGLACDEGNPSEKLNTFLKRRFGDIEHSPTRGGTVITSGPINKTYAYGLIAVGDAACQTKPTTGGGAILGGLCAIEAGNTAADAIEAKDASARFLQRYQRTWQDLYGKEFRAMSVVRSMANHLSDEQLDEILGVIKYEGLEQEIGRLVEDGDMDMQRGVIVAGLKNLGLAKALIKVAGRVAFSGLRGVFNV